MTLEQSWHRIPGGTAVAALGMARALSRRDGLELVGVAALHRNAAPQEWALPVATRQLPLPRFALYESWHLLRRPKLEVATGRVDVIHATTIIMPPRSAPVVLTIHDLWFLRNPDHATKRGIRLFTRALELALREADLVLCPSRWTMSDCNAAGFEPQRLRLVPFGVDSDPVTPDDVRRVRSFYGLHAPYVLWTGTVEPRKNLKSLLQAFRLIDEDLDLVLVGPRGWNEDLEAAVGRERSRVRMLGFVPRADLLALYAGAAVFCLPSIAEGFGFPVLEAMAQETPVVTSTGSSTEELAKDAGVLVDPTDPASIATGIESVVHDDALAARLARAGRARASHYTWERTADLVTAAYQEVAA